MRYNTNTSKNRTPASALGDNNIAPPNGYIARLSRKKRVFALVVSIDKAN